MDPDLSRIRRERHLAHKRDEDSAAGKGKSANDARAGAAAAGANPLQVAEDDDVIVIDSDSDEETDERKPSTAETSSSIAETEDEIIVIDSDSENESDERKPGNDAVEHICYLDERSGMLYDTHPQVEDDGDPGGWIRARNPRKDADTEHICYLDESCERNPRRKSGVERQEDVQGMKREFNMAVARGDDINSDSVLDIAIRHGVVSGKWLIRHKAIPAILWAKIRNAIFNDELGPAAKILKSWDNGLFIICIYCADFRDKREVLRVRQGLNRVLKNGKYALYWKPDAFTLLDIYDGPTNQHRIKPTIYGSGGKNDPECSVLTTNKENCTHRPGCPRCFPRCKEHL